MIKTLPEVCVRHKFNAKSCEHDGKKFPSKLEFCYYKKLIESQKAGEIVFFLRQIPLELGGGVRYFVDFLVFFTSGEVEFVETKGFDTEIGRAKRKIAENLYPIKIKIVSKI